MDIAFAEAGKSGMDWSAVLDAAKCRGCENIDGVDASFGSRAAELVLSVSEDGVGCTAVPFMPALDAPSGTGEWLLAGLCEKLGGDLALGFTDAQIEAFCGELASQMEMLGENLGLTGSSTIADSKASQCVLFDIYMLMALLVECGQKMRDAARDVRQAENVQVQKSIQNQADMQRAAALTGLVCSIAVCAIQIGAQTGNIMYQGKGFGKQMDAQKMSGLENAKSELEMAQMQSKPQDAQTNFEKASENVDPATKVKVESSFNDSRATKATMGELEGDAKAEALELYRAQVKGELADVRSNPASTPEEIAYAEAYAANEIAQNSTPKQLADDLAVAQANYNQANAVMQHDIGYMKGVHMENRSRMFGDLIAAIGNVAQGCISNMSQMIGAEATEEGAQQQKAQEMLDQAKDLFAQCQSLIDSVIQLMQAVLHAEIQSMRDAIHA